MASNLSRAISAQISSGATGLGVDAIESAAISTAKGAAGSVGGSVGVSAAGSAVTAGGAVGTSSAVSVVTAQSAVNSQAISGDTSIITARSTVDSAQDSVALAVSQQVSAYVSSHPI